MILKPHEKTNKTKLIKVINSIKKHKLLFFPVIIENSNYVILDGHHRIKAFKALGIKKIPCFLVNYFSDEIQLKKRRKEIKINKNLVIKNALNKKLFPFKTTNHVFELFKINYKLEVQKCKK